MTILLVTAGLMPRDQIVLQASEIPPDCLCTYTACGNGEMRLKFTHGRCGHAGIAAPWDYRAWWRGTPLHEIEPGRWA